MSGEPEFVGLGEHFFRHEYGRLTAVLLRKFGVAQFGLVEDAVQTALLRGLQAWRQRGVPLEPAAWLTRAAVNAAVDLLRNQQAERRRIEHLQLQTEVVAEDDALSIESPPHDEPLRLLFLCCHPDIPLESRVALALRTVSGFSAEEIAAALLITKANAEKRTSRAKEALRSIGTELTQLNSAELARRLPTVQATVYLLFTEGYASTASDSVLRRDLSDEAIRLTRMLVGLPEANEPSSFALLALMIFHSARFDSRIDAGGAYVLLDQQDRTRWDWARIREAMHWMQRSATGETLSRYHVEAAIAWEHCRAESSSQTDWRRVAELYSVLCRIADGPMVRLNHAIAVGYAESPRQGLDALLAVPDSMRQRLRPWWDCAVADAYLRCSQRQEAEAHLQDALRLATSPAQHRSIEQKLQQVASVGQ